MAVANIRQNLKETSDLCYDVPLIDSIQCLLKSPVISNYVSVRLCIDTCIYFYTLFRFSTHIQMISVWQTSVMVAHSRLMPYFKYTLMVCKFIYSTMKWRYIITNLLYNSPNNASILLCLRFATLLDRIKESTNLVYHQKLGFKLHV